VPNDDAFQKRVLLATLKLLEASSGPVLQDFPEDAPVLGEVSTAWACPVNLSTENVSLSDSEQLREALKREMAQLRSWFDLAVKKRGRTTVGVSGLVLDAIGEFVSAFIEGGFPENPRRGLPLWLVLKLAVDDLKAYYFEAVTAQPGQGSPGSDMLANWFWEETVAAKVLLAVKQSCINSDDNMLKAVGAKLIVPMAQAHRKA
jgi:hypothetical protein